MLTIQLLYLLCKDFQGHCSAIIWAHLNLIYQLFTLAETQMPIQLPPDFRHFLAQVLLRLQLHSHIWDRGIFIQLTKCRIRVVLSLRGREILCNFSKIMQHLRQLVKGTSWPQINSAIIHPFLHLVGQLLEGSKFMTHLLLPLHLVHLSNRVIIWQKEENRMMIPSMTI